MPKLSLKRRHRRQHDLCLLRDSPVESRLNRETASRMVSDDDIKYSSSSDEPSGSAEANEEPSPVPTKPIRRMRKVESIKLPSQLLAPSCDSAPKSMIGSTFLPCISPSNQTDTQIPFPSDESSRKRPHNSVSSPWGQFVDMVIPASPSDDSLSAEKNRDDGDSGCYSLPSPKRRFLPSCPSPRPPAQVSPSSPRCHHPYLRPRTAAGNRRQPIRAPKAHGMALKGWVLHVPNESVTVEEAESALKGLSF